MTLRVRDLHASYGSRPVLDGINVTVAPGELVALLGPNGCGKTTLLRAITRALTPTSGSVEIGGESALRMNPRQLARRIATVAQGATLPPRFTAFECVLMGRTPYLSLFQSESAHDADVVRAAMERADCWRFRSRFVEELSGGERQRVVIARALAQEPDLLLLDEPTSHLDLQHQVETFRLVVELCREQDLAALAVVHDVTLAATYADRIALMFEGRIIASGKPSQVLREDLLERVYGVPVRILTHPVTGRPIAVPETTRLAAPDVAWLARVADPMWQPQPMAPEAVGTKL
jgi:iron complex transport system ATP-binding protein